MSDAAPWTADRAPDAAGAAAAIHDAVPDLAGCEVRLLGYGGGDPDIESRARFLGTCFSFMDWAWWVEVGNDVAERAARRTLGQALP